MRAQGWAEAEKAKAQRKPAAMREHEQIFGQAPSRAHRGRVEPRSRPLVCRCGMSPTQRARGVRPSVRREKVLDLVPGTAYLTPDTGRFERV